MKNRSQNSIKFLHKTIAKKTGFSAPSKYFEKVEDTIFAKVAEKNIPKTTGFQNPNNYFATLEDKILHKTTLEKELKTIPLYKRTIKLIPLAIAASFILFIGIFSSLFNKKTTITFDDLAESDIEVWFHNTANINISDLSFILTDSDFDKNELLFTTLKDNTIEEYIDSNNTSIPYESFN